ncbi:MAG: SoxR reducing system RseC family protein [Bacteroidetes bacterium]|nr:SoxR reducing system RseC family protein [Bacteroidota bacterium]
MISHKGVVEKIEQGYVYVKILSESACSACHSKQICGLANKKEKIIEVKNVGTTFCKGENVIVEMKESLGLKAVLFAYLFPLILLISSLFIFIPLTKSEIFGFLISAGILALYYYFLNLMKEKIKHTFEFKIRKEISI